MTLELLNVTKYHGSHLVLKNISFQVKAGELLTLLGPSGCGKTSTLRIIAGLESASHGVIRLNGQGLNTLAPADRAIGFVFQNYALFNHMTVAENVAFGLSVRPRRLRPCREDIMATVAELLDYMHLNSYAQRFPGQLSGGQKQRVALARALAIRPKVLLLDEPFSALDREVRLDLRKRLKSIQQELGITCVLVTHDHDEAWELSERVVVMKSGRIDQVGEPREILTPNFKRRNLGAYLLQSHPIQAQ